MSREDKASELYYVLGDAKEQDLKKFLRMSGKTSIRVIHIRKLYRALAGAVNLFIYAMEGDENKGKAVEMKATKFFCYVPNKIP